MRSAHGINLCQVTRGSALRSLRERVQSLELACLIRCFWELSIIFKSKTRIIRRSLLGCRPKASLLVPLSGGKSQIEVVHLYSPARNGRR